MKLTRKTDTSVYDQMVSIFHIISQKKERRCDLRSLITAKNQNSAVKPIVAMLSETSLIAIE